MKRIVLLTILIAATISPAYGQKVERLNFVGGPPSGVFGIFATGIGTYLSRNVANLDVSVTATGGSVENIRRVNGGEAEMGVSFSSDVHEAYFGLEQFKGKPLTNYRAIGLIFFGVAHAITYADSGIR
ncbi:MAG: TAXI family TRAP transporter solute-binding subunit, partial [Candidatus Binatia bacterium]